MLRRQSRILSGRALLQSDPCVAARTKPLKVEKFGVIGLLFSACVQLIRCRAAFLHAEPGKLPTAAREPVLYRTASP